MTPTEELLNIDAQIDRLTQEVERLLCVSAARLSTERTLIKGLPLHLQTLIVHHVLHRFVEDL